MIKDRRPFVIAIEADRVGMDLKATDHEARDMGGSGGQSVLYLLFAGQVLRELAALGVECGVLISGTGTGMSVVANDSRTCGWPSP